MIVISIHHVSSVCSWFGTTRTFLEVLQKHHRCSFFWINDVEFQEDRVNYRLLRCFYFEWIHLWRTQMCHPILTVNIILTRRNYQFRFIYKSTCWLDRSVGCAVIMASSKFEMEPVMRVATLKQNEIYGDEEQTAAVPRCTCNVLNLFLKIA